jgi:hypothetical protein
MIGGMDSEPEHQNANGDGQHDYACQAFLKPNKDKAD